MQITETSSVREIVVALPASTRLFEGLGIDYCCGGQRPLGEACAKAAVPVDEVLRSINRLAATPPAEPERDWQREPLAALISHIVEKHHVYTKDELPRLERLLNKVCDAHGQRHPELLGLREMFSGLQAELNTHLLKEEQVLFPYIERLEEAFAAQRAVAPPFFGTVRNPVRMMMNEHDTAGETLEMMRAAAGAYAVPADACPSYRTLYGALAAFEADLHQHIHLENNILFPRAEAMEREVAPARQAAGEFNEHRCFGH
jgi:regulator of cell morphogenesis and NO signaling